MHHQKAPKQELTPRRARPSVRQQGRRPQWWDEELADRERHDRDRYHAE